MALNGLFCADVPLRTYSLSLSLSLSLSRGQTDSSSMQLTKTEFLWSSSGRRVDQVPSTPVRAGTDSISPASSVRNLRIYLDSNISMTTHVSKTVSSCFLQLSDRSAVSNALLLDLSLVQLLVLTRLDYGNATLAGLSRRLTARDFMSVLHAAARLIYRPTPK